MRLTALALLLVLPVLRADEGMWTFDNLPLRQLKEKYGFAPDAAWLRRLQLATLKFPGGTGAFVSADGLVVTNHHVGRGAVAQLSSRDRDLIREGFVAASRDQELKVPGLALEVLESTRNVTDQVKLAAAGAKTDAAAAKARRDALARLRAEAEQTGGLTCEGVTLYQGGEYWIYSYRRFQDIRLVVAPEEEVADFGHDADNYSYPRFCLDFALFRVYENGQPYRSEAFLPFASTPLKAGDFTLISGQPGVTFRQWTVAQMKQDRDLVLPWQIRHAERLEQAMLQFSEKGPEARRLAAEVIKGLGNGRKRNEARLKGLQSPAAMQRAELAERDFQAAVAKVPVLQAKAGQAWNQIGQALDRRHRLYRENALLGVLTTPNAQPLLSAALDLLRVHGELGKPLDGRLSEFKDEVAVRRRIQSPRPLAKELELARLTASFQAVQEDLGAGHPLTRALLDGRTPAEAAKAAVAGTRLTDQAFRKQLLEAGPEAVAASSDPMLVLARRLDPLHRADRQRMEAEVTFVINEQATRLAEARFQIYGKEQYPDATNTLRISFGTVATYDNGVGTKAQPFTTFAGLFDRHWGWGGNASAAEGGQWTLPQRWLNRQPKLELSTPFNFIYSCDTVGGNSGSPVVNARGEFVGINFDSVYEGQGGYYIYDPATKRAVALDARAILEALRKVLDANHLVAELTGK